MKPKENDQLGAWTLVHEMSAKANNPDEIQLT